MIAQAAQALWGVLSIPKYAVLAFVTAVLVLVLALWLPNIVLVREITMSDAVPVTAKLRILVGLLGSLTTNYTFATAAALVSASLLFGLNLSLFLQGIDARRLSALGRRTGLLASFGGLASSLVGIGCAACGTFLLGPLSLCLVREP